MNGVNVISRDYGDFIQYRIFDYVIKPHGVNNNDYGVNDEYFEELQINDEFQDFDYSWNDICDGVAPTSSVAHWETGKEIKEKWFESLSDEEKEQFRRNEKRRALNNSVKRSKDKVFEYAQCNKWEFMVTFTFDDKSIPFPYPENPQEFDSDMKVVKQWFQNIQTKYYGGLVSEEKLKYLIVSELGESTGRFHVHGLLANCGRLGFVPARVDKDGRQIYNLIQWKKGFSTAKKIYENFGACAYILKYITKQVALVSSGRSRYLHSANLNTCVIDKQLLDKDQLQKLIFEKMSDPKMIYCKSVKNELGAVVNYISVKK